MKQKDGGRVERKLGSRLIWLDEILEKSLIWYSLGIILNDEVRELDIKCRFTSLIKIEIDRAGQLWFSACCIARMFEIQESKKIMLIHLYDELKVWFTVLIPNINCKSKMTSTSTNERRGGRWNSFTIIHC